MLYRSMTAAKRKENRRQSYTFNTCESNRFPRDPQPSTSLTSEVRGYKTPKRAGSCRLMQSQLERAY